MCRRYAHALGCALLALLTFGAPAARAEKIIDRECGNSVRPEQVPRLLAVEKQLRLMPPNQVGGAPYCVRLAIHIVRRTNGTGGLSLSQLDQGIADCNAAYLPMSISFARMTPIDYIDSDHYFNDVDTAAEIDALKGINPVANAINCYFTPNLSDENGSLCGLSSFTTDAVQGIAFNNDCIGLASNPSTFPHEIGHYFDLFHTHETAFGSELVDESNCGSAGDLLCDTPADPGLTDVVNSSCVYTGTATDANGDSYSPDTHAFMSYSRKTCRDEFSAMSQSKIVTVLTTLRSNHLNCPPVANAGTDIAAECTSHTTTPVQLNGSGSSDPDADPLTYAWSATGIVFDDATSATPTGQFPEGATNVTLVVTAGSVETTDQVLVTVADTTDPVIHCPAAVVLECNDHCSSGGVPATDPGLVAFFAGVSATDACDDLPTITDDRPTCFPVGVTSVTFTARDADGNESQCSSTVTVQDTEPPTIAASLDRTVMWPPNHKLITIHASVSGSDVCDPNPICRLVSITSSEPDNGVGDGDTANDIQGAEFGTCDLEFLLRSERSGPGVGRTYTIIYSMTDHSNNVAYDTSYVRVTHDQGGVASVVNAPIGESSTNVSDVVIAVPSSAVLDARTIDVAQAWIGNTVGFVAPSRTSLADRNHDGLPDLELIYLGSAVVDLQRQSPLDDPLALFYVSGPNDYLVPNLLDASGGTPDIRPVGTAASTAPPARAERIERTELDQRMMLSLATPGRVTAEVFSITGQRVRRIANGEFGIGRFSLRWDGRDEAGRSMPNGIYVTRVTAPGLTAVRKSTLIR